MYLISNYVWLFEKRAANKNSQMENSFKLVFHFQINFEYAGELKESLFLLLTWWKFHVCENEKNLSHFKILKKKEPHLLKSWTTVNNFKLVFDFKLILNMQGILLIVESFMSLKMNGVFGGSIESIEMFLFFFTDVLIMYSTFIWQRV